jgi:hypothetical protein
LILLHDSEDIIASGAGDDAICFFTEEKGSMVCCPSIAHLCLHDSNLYMACLAAHVHFMFVINMKYNVLIKK